MSNGTKTSQFAMTLDEIAKATGWSKMKVRRLEASAMQKLIDYLVHNKKISGVAAQLPF